MTGDATAAHGRRTIGPLIGAAIGMAAFACGPGLRVVNPTTIGWLMEGSDWTTHFLGWHMFRSGPWTVPIGSVPALGYPVGTSVGLTDSIPVVALLAKPIAPLLGPEFQYIGFWLMCCFVLQGMFGALLIASATTSRVVQALGSALFVLAPPLIHRIAHAALTAHWLVIASLWVYFSRRGIPWWVLLVAVAAATHPYLLAMVFAFALAFYGRAVVLDWRRAIPGAVLPIAALGAAALIVVWQAGYLIVGRQKDLQSIGMGQLSMNLLAPVMPLGGSRLFGPGPVSPATAGQYEGYAYLGAGTLLLLASSILLAAVSIRRYRVNRDMLHHVPLALACAVLLLFALSPEITVSSKTIVRYSESWWGPLTLFRATGRFAWPLYYLLVFALIGFVTRCLPFVWSVTLMSAAVALQAADLSASYQGTRVALRSSSWANPLASTFWTAAPTAYKHLILHPTNMCAPPNQGIDFRPFVLLAGRAGTTINAGFAARYDVQKVAEYCNAFIREVDRGAVSPDVLYVTLPKLVPHFMHAAQVHAACTYIDGYGVCFAKETYLRWQVAFDILAATVPPSSELVAFRDVLETEYRDRMQRPLAGSRGAIAERLRWILRYFAYRMSGCAHDEAEQKVVRETQGITELRLCRDHRPDRGALPEPHDTRQFLTTIDGVYRDRFKSGIVETHVDQEGEAAWIGRYVALRHDGAAPREAEAAVLSSIRSIAP